MIVDITNDTVSRIHNPAFADYAAMNLQIYSDFMGQVQATGTEIDEREYIQETRDALKRLVDKGALFRNGGRSIHVNEISPACVTCKEGIGCATFFVSSKCHRNRYYGFHPNQVDYEHYSQHKRNLVEELAQIKSQGRQMSHLAITGGEPLLCKQDVLDRGLNLGVHYCSLENKLTGQNYQQNHSKSTPETADISERDILL